MTTRAVDELVEELHRLPTKSIVHVPFLQYGSTAFKAVMKNLTLIAEEQYKLNALHILYCLCREACPKYFPELLTACEWLVLDDSIKVRSYALAVAIRIIDLNARDMLFTELAINVEEFKAKARQALVQGVTPENKAMIQNFVDTQ